MNVEGASDHVHRFDWSEGEAEADEVDMVSAHDGVVKMHPGWEEGQEEAVRL